MDPDSENNHKTALLDSLQQAIERNPYNPLPYIELATYYLEQGDDDKARKIIMTRRRMPDQEDTHHARWAALCEELGAVRQAIESWEQALSLNRENAEYLYRLGRIYFGMGKLDKAIRLLQKSLEHFPAHALAAATLAEIYEMLGETGSAHALKHKKESPKVTNGKQRKEKHVVLPQIKIEDVYHLLALFKGKEIGYALQEFDQVGRITFSYIDQPLSPNIIIDHLTGTLTLGVYPLRKDNTLKFAAIHLRIQPRKLMDQYKNTSYIVLMEEKIHEYIAKIAGICYNLDIPSYVENAGEHDRRLWFFFAEFLPYQLIQRFLDTFLDRAPSPPADGQVNVLLGLKPLGVGWEYAPLFLPLGVNKKTGKRSYFTDFQGAMYEDQLALIKKVRTIKSSTVREWLQAKNREIQGVSDATPAPPASVVTLCKQCAVIAEIVNRARSGRNLSREEKLVLYYTLGLVNDSGKSIHYILEPTPEYRPHKVDRLIAQLKSNPISCPKIRELLPETTAYVHCDCAFNIPEGGYPSPIIHVNPDLIRGKRDVVLSSPHSLQEAARRYLLLWREVEQLKKSLNRMEETLHLHFEKKKISRISTPFGRIRRVSTKEGFNFIVDC